MLIAGLFFDELPKEFKEANALKSAFSIAGVRYIPATQTEPLPAQHPVYSPQTVEHAGVAATA